MHHCLRVAEFRDTPQWSCPVPSSLFLWASFTQFCIPSHFFLSAHQLSWLKQTPSIQFCLPVSSNAVSLIPFVLGQINAWIYLWKTNAPIFVSITIYSQGYFTRMGESWFWSQKPQQRSRDWRRFFNSTTQALCNETFCVQNGMCSRLPQCRTEAKQSLNDIYKKQVWWSWCSHSSRDPKRGEGTLPEGTC